MGLSNLTKGAKPMRSGTYLAVGFYELEITELSIIKAQSSVNYFTANFKIVSYEGPHASEEKPGLERSWQANPSGKYNEAWEILKFLGAVSGIKGNEIERIEAEITDEVQDLAIDSSQPMKGMRVQCEVKAPKDGKTFTKKIFIPANA